MPAETPLQLVQGKTHDGGTPVHVVVRQVGREQAVEQLRHLARGQPLPNGVESATITRQCTFTFTATPPAGMSSVGWGTTVLGGTYAEAITGLHKQAITVGGTFQLRRVSEIGAITLN